MGSGFEPVAISAQKHDPAWKHCEMYKDGDRVQLKCIYCTKIFRGGGIHRIKEHLACQKGNASTCHRVPPDVKQAMQQSLEVVVGKKKRKQKICDESTTSSINPTSNDEIDGLVDECGVSTGVDLIANSNVLEPNSTMMGAREEEVSVRLSGKRRRGRPPKDALISMGKNGALVPGSDDRHGVNEMQFSSKTVSSQVHLAIGRFIYDIGVPLDAVNSVYFQPDVKQAMQQSLEVVVGKKKRKQKICDESTTSSINPTSNDEIDGLVDECGVSTGVDLIANSNVLEPNSTMMGAREEEVSVRLSGKRRRGRPPKDALISMGKNGALVPGSDDRHGVNEMQFSSKTVSSQVHLAIGRFIYDIGVPLDAVNSVYFQPMLDAIALEGTGVVGPSHHDLRGWTLKSAVSDVKADMEYCAKAWGRTGCSVLVEECVIGKEKEMTVLNFLVYCPQGTMFVKSVDVTSMTDSAESIFDLIKEVVEEAGLKNVLQLITPNKECYASIGRRISETCPTLYWAPCAANSITLMLEDFGKFEWVNTVLEQCKSITRFIYNHSIVLNMMRRYTFGVDIVVPDLSPFITNFRTVKRMIDLKHNLQALVTSQEWVDSCFSKKEGALAILDLVSDHSFWSSCNLVVHLTDPVLRVLSIVRSDKKPAMGFVYAGLYRAKEAMKREFRKRDEYLTYWNVIDQRWEHHQQLPLYAAGFYLNPAYFYSIDEDLPGTIVSGMFDCIERLVPDTKIQDKIIKELNSYKTAAGDFGRKMAVRARESLLPSEWWSTYGGACPNLSRLAIRILSQCCSLTHCKKDLIPLEQMHNTVNSLEHQRLSDQIFTQYNLRLRQMAQQNKEHDNTDPLSVDNHDSVANWISRKELCLDDHGSSDWMAIELPSPSKMRLNSSIEFEELGSGFDDYEIFGGAKVDDDDALGENTEGQ